MIIEDFVDDDQEVAITIGEESFILNVRQTTEEERGRYDGLTFAYGSEKDPNQAARFYAAREMLVQQCVVGWKNIVDKAGEPIKFTRENFEKILRKRPIRKSIEMPLYNHFYGNQEEAAKKTGEPVVPLSESTPAAAGEKSPD